MNNGENNACTQPTEVNPKYDQCKSCMEKTGFNPAFYHADTISKQQLARNAEPHIVYLANFAPGLNKVGISLAARGFGRLLEQGARSAVILGEFPSANVARSYEAKIAGKFGIHETIQLAKKLALVTASYDNASAETELLSLCTTLSDDLLIDLSHVSVEYFDRYYFENDTPDLSHALDMTDKCTISGEVRGMIGSILITEYDDRILYLCLKKYTGYHVVLREELAELDLPAEQASLF